MDRRKIIGFVGAGLLALGTFLPVVSLPLVGSMNYFANAQGDGTIVLVIAAASAGLVAINRYKWLWLTSAGAAVILAVFVVRFLVAMNDVQNALAEDLAGNPFAGLAEGLIGSVQLEIGVFVMFAGAILLGIAAALSGPRASGAGSAPHPEEAPASLGTTPGDDAVAEDSTR